jgi:hypothetical protein
MIAELHPTIWQEYLEERDHYEDLGTSKRKLIKWDSSGSRGLVAGFGERSNKTLSSINTGNFLIVNQLQTSYESRFYTVLG